MPVNDRNRHKPPKRKSKQARRKRTSVCGGRNSAQKFDSHTLVHTVGDGVSRSWGPTRDVAHPPVNAGRTSPTLGRRVLPERLHFNSAAVQYTQYCSVPTSICRYGRLRAVFRPVFFLVRLPGVVVSKVFGWRLGKLRAIWGRDSARDCWCGLWAVSYGRQA